MTIYITNPTPAQVDEIVRLSYGKIDPNDPMYGRYRDGGRDVLAGRLQPENDAAASFLAELQIEAEKRETDRIATLTADRARTASQWADFDARRAAASAPPPGIHVVHVRDELTRELVKLHIPVEFVQN